MEPKNGKGRKERKKRRMLTSVCNKCGVKGGRSVGGSAWGNGLGREVGGRGEGEGEMIAGAGDCLCRTTLVTCESGREARGEGRGEGD